MPKAETQRVALVTGASAGFGKALANALATNGWTLVIDARGEAALRDVAYDLGDGVTAIPGDVTDRQHREALRDAIANLGRLDLLVNNASYLGPSPQPQLGEYPLDELRLVYEVDVIAPLALTQILLPWLTPANGTVINISSDAAVEAYEGWGGYGSAKAALDQISAILGAEHPDLHVYAFDPGDMRTAMHQQAYPDEDISDRPEPETVVPSLLRLLEERPPSGRYRSADFTVTTAARR
jgi:NAD(P)-dependent dehydrogenase (short-subunit alcohol dehydrogenase family)